MFVQLVKDFQGQKAGTRIDVTEADAKTLLDAGIAARVEGDQLAPLVQKSMEGMLAGITDTLTKSIDAVLKQFAEAHTKSNKNKVKAIFGEDGDGDPKKTFGRLPPGRHVEGLEDPRRDGLEVLRLGPEDRHGHPDRHQRRLPRADRVPRQAPRPRHRELIRPATHHGAGMRVRIRKSFFNHITYKPSYRRSSTGRLAGGGGG